MFLMLTPILFSPLVLNLNPLNKLENMSIGQGNARRIKYLNEIMFWD